MCASISAIPLTDKPDAKQHATSGHRRWFKTMTAPHATWTAVHCLFHGNGSKPDENISQANMLHTTQGLQPSRYPRPRQTRHFAHHMYQHNFSNKFMQNTKQGIPQIKQSSTWIGGIHLE